MEDEITTEDDIKLNLDDNSGSNKTKKIIIILFVLAVIAIATVIVFIFFKKDNNAAEKGVYLPYGNPEGLKNLEGTVLNNCHDLSGTICQVGQECPGNWLDASDSFSCCSQVCQDIISSELNIQPFEIDPQNEAPEELN